MSRDRTSPSERLASLVGHPVRRFITAVQGRREHQQELRRLEGAPWDSPPAMDALRLARLRATVDRAAEHSPFYRELLGGRAPELTSFDDLQAIPVTSKAEITASGLDRASRASILRPRTTWRTSGSSGVPFVFDVDLTYGARHDAQRAYVYRRAGLAPGSRIVEVLGFGSHLAAGTQVSYPTFRRTVVGYGRDDLTAVVSEASPALLYGNRSHLLAIADEVAMWGRRPPLRFVCSSSETLHAADRDRLFDAFGARILEVYGSAEASNIAFRLNGDESWTTLEPRILVEVLDQERQPVRAGEIGEIVVTTLIEPTAPLLRYATGDLARVAAGSSRGWSGLRLGSLEGRLTDALVDVHGRRVGFWNVAYAAFWAADDIAKHVRRWQVHQLADRSVTVSLELTDDGAIHAVASAIEQHVRSKIGAVPVRIIESNDLHDPSIGKFRAVTSAAVPIP